MILKSMKGFIVSATYDTVDNQTMVRLFGRLENGHSFVTTNTIKPYFFVQEKDAEKHARLLSKYTVGKTSLTTFKHVPVIRVIAQNQQELNKLTEVLHKMEVDTFEADVKPHTRFLIDHNLFGSVNIEGNPTSSERIDSIYEEPEISHAILQPKLKVLSLDIESSKSGEGLFCIGLFGENYEKTFLITSTKEKMKNVVQCATEEECLQKFKEEMLAQDPDIITGWNIIDFDLVYLRDSFKKHKISFAIGRTNEETRLRIESGFFKSSTADISGRQVLDAFNLIKDPYIKEAPSIKNAEFESFSLESVAQAILGTGKLIKGKNRHDEIEKLYAKDQQRLVDYNILDCKLAFDILKKTAMLDLAIERSELTGMPLDRLGASVAAFDSLYIREARKRGLVSPTTRYVHKDTGITGGYVKSSKAGIYHNVVVLDFKSLYPSIMRTFNIDPASLLDAPEKGAIESPNKVYFKNQEGILSILIEKMHIARENAKKEKRELASYAIKIIMNSMFGVLANPNCRFYNYNMANAITHFGQMIIKLTAEQIEKKGYKVIYSDTDSCFVETGFQKEKAHSLGKELQAYINDFYNDYVQKNYARKSYLELQFAKLYFFLMIPAIRTSAKAKDEKKSEEKAAKKRYAGLLDMDGKEELEIVGLEAIRGDWTEAAQDFQRELLMKIFHREPPEAFIRQYAKKIREGKLDSKLIYRKSIRKNLTEYTKTTPPHVKAARLLDVLEGNRIEYIVTTEGPEPLQKLKHKPDYDHYLEKQITPIANQILSLFGTSFDDVIKGSKQKTLF